MLMVDRVLTIAGVIERLSFAQLAYAGGTYDPDARVTSVTIADSDDLADQETGSLVLGVGLKDPAHVIESLHGLARADPVALVVRAPFDVTGSGHARKFVGGSGPGGGVGEVEAAGGVEGVFGGATH